MKNNILKYFPRLYLTFLDGSHYISGYKNFWEEFYKNSYLEMWIPYVYNISLRNISHGFYSYTIFYILMITYRYLRDLKQQLDMLISIRYL
jgi:hypothetical protein